MEQSPRRSFLFPGERRVGLSGSDGPSFLGGMRWLGFNATWPLVRLTLLTEGFRMEASTRLFRGVVPAWEARYDDLEEVQSVGKIPLFSTGIRLRTKFTKEWIVYWTPKRRRVLTAIADRGVTVNRDPIRFHYLDPSR